MSWNVQESETSLQVMPTIVKKEAVALFNKTSLARTLQQQEIPMCDIMWQSFGAPIPVKYYLCTN